MIYTIGREFGSGGTWGGRELAKKLNIPFYDKEILTRTAAESNICRDLIKQKDEKYNWSDMFYGQAMHGGNMTVGLQMPLQQRIFMAQFDVISKIASEGPCVIVGRCADYVLRERNDLFRVFVYANEETRVRRIMDIEIANGNSCDENAARDKLRKSDKQRKNYYNFFSDGDWGLRNKYDLMLRSDNLNYEQIADVIIAMSKVYEQK